MVEQRHLAFLRRRNLRPSTIYQRQRVLVRFTRTLGPRRSPLGATKGDLEAYLDSINDPNTRATEMSHLRGFYRWAVTDGLIRRDPTVTLPAIRRRKCLPRPMPHQDLRRALAGAPDRIRPWLYLAAYAGLRACEIARLRVEDVQWTDGMILVVEGKGGHMSAVPLSPILAAVLHDCLPAGGWAFGRRDGKSGPNAAWTVSHLANAYLHGLGITHTLHTGRHWFGTEVNRLNGGDLRETQELLRHESIVSTVGYTKVNPRRGKKVVARLRV